jgi:hypothetical protein
MPARKQEGNTGVSRNVKKLSVFLTSWVVVILCTVQTPAQPTSSTTQQPGADPAIKATQVFGKVSEINSSAGQITIKTAAGSLVVANVNDKTTYQRMPPGETDRSKAEQTSLTEITVGDGIIARGFVAADRKSLPAQQIIVVSQSEIAKKNAAERMAWARGARGIVSSVNAAAKEVTVTSRSLAGMSQAIIVGLSEKTKIKRYPPDSVPRYENASPGNFEDIKVGDQLNAKGEKSADGARLTAEEILFGTFKIAGGTVTAIDAATSQIKIADLQKKTPLTITLKPESVIRRLPEGFGAFAGGGMGQGAGAGTGPRGASPGQGQAPVQGNNAAAQRPQGAGPGGGPGGGMRMGGGNMADLLERLPTISINDLKVGDTIILSSLPGSDPTQLTAISVVSGVEPLLAMMAARQQAGGPGRPQAVDLNSNFGGMFGGIGVP